MSVSIGGLCIMPLRNYLLGVLLGRLAFRSMFFVVLSLAVLLILGESHIAQQPCHRLSLISVPQHISPIHPKHHSARISPNSPFVSISVVSMNPTTTTTPAL